MGDEERENDDMRIRGAKRRGWRMFLMRLEKKMIRVTRGEGEG